MLLRGGRYIFAQFRATWELWCLYDFQRPDFLSRRLIDRQLCRCLRRSA